MPEVVKEHQFSRLGRNPQYDQYLDGQIYKWSKDELKEFSKGADTVRSGVTSAAARNGLSIRSQILEDGSLIMQAYEKEKE